MKIRFTRRSRADGGSCEPLYGKTKSKFIQFRWANLNCMNFDFDTGHRSVEIRKCFYLSVLHVLFNIDTNQHFVRVECMSLVRQVKKS